MRALVTWASSWFGAEFAKQLAEKWYDLILAARSKDKLEALWNELSQKHWIKTQVYTVDLWNMEWIDKICSEIIDKEDIDLLINNAWRWNPEWLLDSTEENLESMMTLNMFTIVFLTQRMTNRWLNTTKKWRIINVGSTSAFLFDWVFPLYAATKAFVRSISSWFNSTLEDIEGHDIKIQCLCPWLTKTNFMWLEERYTSEELTSFWFMDAPDVVKISLDKLDSWEEVVITWERNKETVKWFGIAPIEEQRKAHKEFVAKTWLTF